jgi:hypothetical protein
LVRAASAAARKALATILPEFFTQAEDGWHQKRCDEEIEHYRERADQARENGKRGGRPTNPPGNQPGIQSGSIPLTGSKANQNHEPVTNKTNTGAARLPSGSRRKPQTTVPEDFAVSEGVQKWAAANGIGRLQAHLEHFKFTCAAKGYVYSDHDAAFKKAIRGDWAKLGAEGRVPKLTVLPDLPRRDGDIPDAAKALIAKMRAHG